MATRIGRFFAPPRFDDEPQQRTASLVHGSLLLLSGILLPAWGAILLAYGLPGPDVFGWLTVLSCPAIIGVNLGLLRLVQRGRLKLAGTLLCAILWLTTTLAISFYGGLLDLNLTGYFLVVIIAGLVLGPWAMAIFAVLSLAVAAVLLYVETTGLVVYARAGAEVFDLIVLVVTLTLTAILIRYAMRSMALTLQRARNNEAALAETNRALQASQAELSQRVSDVEVQRGYLQAASEIGRVVASILDVDQLSQQTVDTIRDYFALDYAGLIQTEVAAQPGDEPGSTSAWAVLHAVSGEPGCAPGPVGHRIPVTEGLIGRSITHAEPRWGPAEPRSAGEPSTQRFEAALPLSSRGHVLGALHLSSRRPEVFGPDGLGVLATLADQVAVALDNARLFEDSQVALETARGVYGQVTREAWQELLRSQAGLGFRRDAQSLAPAGDVWQPEMTAVLQTGKTVTGADGAKTGSAATPIKVRGQTVGVIDAFKPDEAGAWSAEEIAALETLADQLGMALESARLFQDVRRRAAHEQAVRHITEQMRRALEVESILQATVAELGQALGVPRAYVRLGTTPPPPPVGTEPGRPRQQEPQAPDSAPGSSI